MKIILLKSVAKLGRAGEMKDVKEGYARNYLIPAGLADLATKHSLNVLGAQKKKKERSKKELTKKKKILAEKINGKKIIIKAKADKKGSLYAGLNAALLAEEFANQGFGVAVSEIKLDKTIKKTGKFDVGLNLSGEKVKIMLEVKGEDEKPPTDA